MYILLSCLGSGMVLFFGGKLFILFFVFLSLLLARIVWDYPLTGPYQSGFWYFSPPLVCPDPFLVWVPKHGEIPAKPVDPSRSVGNRRYYSYKNRGLDKEFQKAYNKKTLISIVTPVPDSEWIVSELSKKERLMDELRLQSLSRMITGNLDSVIETDIAAKNILTWICALENGVQTQAQKIARSSAFIKHEL
jgi:hypothetical protein